MSLDAILKTALSSLNAQQPALRVTADNVANVNTPGYARKEVQFQSRALGGTGIGVEVGEIRRISDLFLQKEVVRATALSAYLEVQNSLHDRVQLVLGEPGQPNTLAGRLDTLFRAFDVLAADPAEAARRIGAIQDMQTVAVEFSRLADELQRLRGEADRQLVDEVNAANDALSEIHALNGEINAERGVGRETQALQERRAQALQRLAAIIDINTAELSGGAVHVFTGGGQVLLDSARRALVYTPAGTADPATRFTAITANRVDDATGATTASGEALYANLRSGRLKGLIDMRDIELPRIAEGVGELAARLVDQFNAAHNDNSTVPAPNSLTGRNVGALGTDAHRFTGQVTFARLDSAGTIAAQYTIDFSDLTLVTLNDVVARVNANVGGATLSLSAGAMRFQATAGTDGVALLQSTTAPSSCGGRGFADYFGVNDLMRARAPSHFDTGLTAGAAHGFGATGTVAFEVRGPGGQVAASYTLNLASVGATVNDIVTALNTNLGSTATFALDSAGRLSATPTAAFADFQPHVVNDTTTRGATALSLSDYFGLGARKRPDQALNMTVRSDILANPGKLATAKLDPSVPVGTPAVNPGDVRGAFSLQQVARNAVAFRAAGDVPAISGTLASYAGTLLGTVASEAARIQTSAEDRAVLLQEVVARRDELAGVNMDEELANMVIFQNAYNVAARLIATSNELYRALLEIV